MTEGQKVRCDSAFRTLLHNLGNDIVLSLTTGRVSQLALWVRAAKQTRKSSHLTHLHIFEAVLLSYTPEHVLFAALLHLTGQQ